MRKTAAAVSAAGRERWNELTEIAYLVGLFLLYFRIKPKQIEHRLRGCWAEGRLWDAAKSISLSLSFSPLIYFRLHNDQDEALTISNAILPRRKEESKKRKRKNYVETRFQGLKEEMGKRVGPNIDEGAARLRATRPPLPLIFDPRTRRTILVN